MGEEKKITTEVFKELLPHLIQQDFKKVSKICRGINCRVEPVQKLLTLLTITFPWKEHIKGRTRILKALEEKLLEEVGRTRTNIILGELK